MPQIVDRPCRHYGPDALSWPEHPGAGILHARHLRGARRPVVPVRRAFEPSVPEADLAEVAKGKYLRRDAAPLGIRMLDDAREALRQAKAAGDPKRSPSARSASPAPIGRRCTSTGCGMTASPATWPTPPSSAPACPAARWVTEAAQWLARWIGGWLAAPGFSNHNDGRALDLFCRLTSGRVLTADRADIPRWQTSWLHQWLTANAARYDFHPYQKEPWHWEHRPGSASATQVLPRARGRSRVRRRSPRAGPLIAGGTGSRGLLAQPAAFRTRGKHRRAAHRRARRLPGHPAGHRVSRGQHPLHLPARLVDGPLGEPHRSRDLPARPVRAGRGARRPGPGAGLGRPLAVRPAAVEPCHDEAVHAINRLPNCHAEQDDSGSSRKSHHQKLLVVQGRDGLVALCGGVDVNADRVHDLPPPRGSYRADRPDVGWSDSRLRRQRIRGSGNPLHDVHARLTGPTALPLLRVFLRRWWARSGDRDIDRRSPLRGSFSQPLPAPTGSQFVRVGETFNGVLQRARRAMSAAGR